MKTRELKVGSNVITSRGLFGTVTAISGDRIMVRIGSKDVPIFRRQLVVSDDTVSFQITYSIGDDPTEYLGALPLPRHAVIFSATVNLETMASSMLFKQTGKKVNIVEICVV